MSAIEPNFTTAARQCAWLNITECGAVSDGATSSTAAIQRAIDRCGAAGGGTVLVPPGRFVMGSIQLRSHVTLHLEPGATILADENVSAYPIWTPRWDGRLYRAYAPLIAGEDLDNVTLSGRGVIDGRGARWWDLFQQNKLETTRPALFRIVNCRDVIVDGLTFVNSPRWTVNPTACDNVTIDRITIRNPADSPNTDGINPDSCSNVHISNCHVDVGDDCITIKSGCEEDGRPTLMPCQNVTITNCTMLHGHGGVVIGSEMSGGVRNVAISNCVFSGTDRGIRLKSRRGRGSAIEDLRVDNVVMDQVLCPIVLNLFYGCGAWNENKVTDQSPQPVDAGTPRFRRLRFSNISARNVKYAAAFVLGLPERFVEDVAFDGFSVYLDQNNKHGGSPAMAPGIPDMCRAGMIVRNASNIRMSRIDIHDQLGPAIDIENSNDISVTDLHAHRDGNHPLIRADGRDAAEFDHDPSDSGHNGRSLRPVPISDRPAGRRPGRLTLEPIVAHLKDRAESSKHD